MTKWNRVEQTNKKIISNTSYRVFSIRISLETKMRVNYILLFPIHALLPSRYPDGMDAARSSCTELFLAVAIIFNFFFPFFVRKNGGNVQEILNYFNGIAVIM